MVSVEKTRPVVEVPEGHWRPPVGYGGDDEGFRYERPVEGGWRVAVHLALRDEQVIVAELRLFPDPYRSGRMSLTAYQWAENRGQGTRDGGWGTWSGQVEDLEAADAQGITKQLLRHLPLSEVVAEAQTQWEIAASALEQLGLVEGGWADAIRGATSKPKRHKRPDSLYAHAAARYAALVRAGHRRPVQQMARESEFTVPAITEWIKESRARGFLTATTPGRAGGELTEKAIAVLKKGEK